MLQSLSRTDVPYVVLRLCNAGKIEFLGRVATRQEFEQYRNDCGFDKSDIVLQEYRQQNG